ncbi:MAG TPA: lysophospholipid acyltransferase family protein [Smithellaceae bacterium]|nr:lysophospholipid acyltransferase family protein [Smithellaceae bacterium]HRS89085.1 lysophospholipid acyltransferase family protein [Smithellaceae bacterium]HRV26021.1 lysophospholipid acyltransferase family protein [Smithellaceae bacterium]
MDKKSKVAIRLQNFLGRLAVVFVAPFYFSVAKILFYRVKNLKEIRRQFALEYSRHKGPWIICANHLTMIDSFLLGYAAFSLTSHFVRFKRLPWNLPERSNFQRNIFLALLCYLAKCIPIDRGGSREKIKETLDKCIYLLNDGHSIMIFPEGGRSRSGRINKESFSYGVGRLIKDVENCKIMCMYLRGDKQKNYSAIPAWGDKFTVLAEVFTPARVEGSALRVQRDYAAQIVEHLARMEEKYFALYRERHCGSAAAGQHEIEPGFTLSKKSPNRC